MNASARDSKFLWNPFRILALGYSDGPTVGFIELSSGPTFMFSVKAIDVEREMRVVLLASVSSEAFGTVTDLIVTALGEPRWPVWVPIWQFDNAATSKAIEESIAAAERGSICYAAVLCDDTLRHCYSVRPVTAEEVAGISDWFAFVEHPVSDIEN